MLLRAQPPAARGHVERCFRVLMRLLDSNVEAVRRHASCCLSLLPACAANTSSRNVSSNEPNSAPAVPPLTLYLLRLIAIAHQTLDVLFVGVVEPEQRNIVLIFFFFKIF